MKLWIGAEMDADVADSFRVVRNRVESAVNGVIMAKSYDLPLNSWDCIAIVRDDEHFTEIVRYSPKRRDMDFRLRIDHTEFKVANPQQQATMIFNMLRRSLDLLAVKLSSPAALQDLQTDLQIAAANDGRP